MRSRPPRYHAAVEALRFASACSARNASITSPSGRECRSLALSAARSSPCALAGLFRRHLADAAERYAPGRGTSPTACLGTPRAPPKWEQGKAIGNIILLAAGLEQG
jgi:hypothetical protein